ncbi:MAG: ATP-binding cassette domain-containing protein [Methanobacteriota archaeon]|nr:MAG: ATP-binding cassette domain-containing protein [Euryarchaeota archaeon]
MIGKNTTNQFLEYRKPLGIKAKNLIKIYEDPSSDSGVIALRGVELNIRPGSMVSIIGPSGAGKSTLLNVLGAITPPTAGELYAGQIPVHSLRNWQLDYYRQHVVGFLWQLPERNLLPDLTAEQNIEFAMAVAGYPREKRKERIRFLLSSVGVWERRGHKLGQLSGGEAQRVGLAVALANEPAILLADEPTGELDSETTMEVIGYLQDLNKDEEITMVIVTHDGRFERMTQQSFFILDGMISGVRRSLDGTISKNWQSAQREELAFVDQYGNLRIPADIRERHGIKSYVRFVSENGRLYIEPVEEDE